jgi:hypothetical protein
MLLALIASVGCLATPVQTLKHTGATVVRSGPVTGGIAPAPAATFRQTFPAAVSPDDVYPSNISPPSAACWRLTMRTGSIKVVFVAIVR